MFLWLTGCAAQPSPWTEALRPAPQEGLRGAMSLSVSSQPLKVGLTAQGGMVTDGTSIRMELRDPMGPPTLRWLMTEGKWTVQFPGNQLNVVASDAERTLRDLTDGAVGLSAFHQLLMGRMSWLPSHIVEQLESTQESEVLVTLKEGPRLRFQLDAERHHVAFFGVENPQGEVLMRVGYGAYEARRPTQFQVEIPRFQFVLGVDLRAWESFTPPPETFTLPTLTAFESVEMERVWPLLVKRFLRDSEP